MSRGPENTFIASVHRHLPAGVYSMKNHNEFNGGIADCWYSGRAGDLWIEYKFLVVPARATTVISLVKDKDPMLSVLQQEWLRDRYEEGRQVHVVVGCKEGGVILHNLAWMKPIAAEDFREALMSRKAIAEWITKRTQGP